MACFSANPAVRQSFDIGRQSGGKTALQPLLASNGSFSARRNRAPDPERKSTAYPTRTAITFILANHK